MGFIGINDAIINLLRSGGAFDLLDPAPSKSAEPLANPTSLNPGPGHSGNTPVAGNDRSVSGPPAGRDDISAANKLFGS